MNNEYVNTNTYSTPVEPTRKGKVFSPDMDIRETDGSIILMADMPGVSAEGLNITLENNVLTIEGSTSMPEPEKHHLIYAEFEMGNFKRAFTISDEIGRHAITATIKNGSLTLELPRAKEAKPQTSVKKGVLSITLPKATPAKTAGKKIQIKTE